MSLLRISTLALAAVAFVALAGTARAADDEENPPPPPPKKTVHKEKEPAKEPAKETKEADGSTDHSKVVGHIGASYFGQFNVPFGAGGAAGGAPATAGTQLVGIRYWTSDSMALDLGLGIAQQSGSAKSGSTTVDQPSLFALSIKAGLPLTMLSGTHYTFFIEPQLIFGYASQSIRPTGGDETKNTGMHLALGATAGAEIQFGFIGIPHLALDGTIGLGLDYQSGTSKTGANPENSVSSTSFGTSAFASPWNIFTSNVAARYYF